MIKGLGAFLLIAFFILCYSLSGFTMGGAAIFLSILVMAFGIGGVMCLTIPTEVRHGGWDLIHQKLPMNVEKLEESLSALSAQIRKDGLLSLESKRKEVSDLLLKYLLKRVMDGFEKAQTLPLIRNQAVRRAELIRMSESFIERLVGAISVIGLIPSLAVLIRGDSVSLALFPFLMAITLQLLAAAYFGKYFDELKEEVKLYYVLMEEGVLGIHEGQNPELLKDRMKARILKEPKWKDA